MLVVTKKRLIAFFTTQWSGMVHGDGGYETYVYMLRAKHILHSHACTKIEVM